MQKRIRQAKTAESKPSSGQSGQQAIAHVPLEKKDPLRPKPFALKLTADFQQKALRLMARLPELLAGENDAPPAKTVGIPTGVSATDLDAHINAALAETGKLLGVSRVYIMLDEENGRYLRNTHEWVDGKIGPAMHSWPLHDYEKDIPSLRGLMADRTFFAGHTKEMPPDMQRVLGMQGVDSVLLAPLLRGGAHIGLLGFDNCGAERIWLEEEIIILRHLTSLVGLFLERREYIDARRALAGIRRLLSLESARGAAVAPTARSGEALATSGKALSLQEAERRLIMETLARCKGNKSQAARELGLKWAALDRRCKKLGIKGNKE